MKNLFKLLIFFILICIKKFYCEKIGQNYLIENYVCCSSTAECITNYNVYYIDKQCMNKKNKTINHPEIDAEFFFKKNKKCMKNVVYNNKLNSNNNFKCKMSYYEFSDEAKPYGVDKIFDIQKKKEKYTFILAVIITIFLFCFYYLCKCCILSSCKCCRISIYKFKNFFKK